jgi:hypothetical protein
LPPAWRQHISIGMQLVRPCIAIAPLPFAID